MAASENKDFPVSVAENGDSNANFTNCDSIGHQKIHINTFSHEQGLNLGIINQNGQLIGEYSRLDDELWFSKPDGTDAKQDSFEDPELKFMFDYGRNVEVQKQSNLIEPICDGSGVFGEESSSSLKDSSIDPSQTTSPVSVLRKRRSCFNVIKTGIKNARSSHFHTSKYRSEIGLHSSGTTFSAMEQRHLFQTETHVKSLLDEISEPIIRTKKIDDLLRSGSGEGDKSPDPKPNPKEKLGRKTVMECLQCKSTSTPQWREGPMGRATLCKACGVQYRKGRLFTGEGNESPDPKAIPKHKFGRKAVKKCLQCESTRTPQWRDGPMGRKTLCNACSIQHRKGKLFPGEGDTNPDSKPIPKQKLGKMPVKKCLHCESTKTPQWREGPMGRNTLCNACGVQYKKGRLFPEYRPKSSPTFDPSLHSNVVKNIQQVRMSE